MGRISKKDLLIILFFILATVFIFRQYFFRSQVPFPANLLVSFYQPWLSYSWEGYPNGPPNKPIGFDNLRIYYPLREFTIETLKKGEIPLWNPHSFAGNVHLGAYQSAVFHPLTFLFFLLPQIDAWSLIVILQPILAAGFMYLFLKAIYFGRRASFFGAFVFAFSGFMIVWWEESFMAGYSALVLPLVLYLAEKFIQKQKGSYFFLLTLSLTASVLSGWFQMTLYVFLLTIFWFIFRLWQKAISFKIFLWLIFSVVLSLFISAVHLIPSLEAFAYSARGSTDAKYLFDEYLLPLNNLLTLVAPDFFGSPAAYNYFGQGFYHERMLFFGLVPLLLVIYEIFSWRKSPGIKKFFILTFLIALSLGFNLPSSWFLLYNLKLPLISVVIPSRIFFLSTFSAAVLVAYGIKDWQQGFNQKRMLWALGFPGLILIIAWGWVLFQKYFVSPTANFATVSLRNLILPSLIYGLAFSGLVIGYRRGWKNLVYLIFLLLTVGSSLYFTNKYLYFSERRFVFPQTPVFQELKKIAGVNRFWSTKGGHIESNLAIPYGLFYPDGYDSFYPRRYGELLDATARQGKYYPEISRSDARINPLDRLEDLQNNFYRQRLLSLLGVRYLVSNLAAEKGDDPAKPISPVFEPLWNDGLYHLFEYQEALPRAFLVGDFVVGKDSQAILDKLFDPKINLAKTMILEEEPASGFIKTDSCSSRAVIVSYKPNEVIIKTETKEPCLLFLADNHYPGWKAQVNGQETKIYRANYSFRAVVTPLGKTTTRFFYRPESFIIGLLGTGVGLLVAVYFLINNTALGRLRPGPTL